MPVKNEPVYITAPRTSTDQGRVRMSEARPPKTVAPWRQKLWVIIFESDTPAGKAFDIILLITIVASVVVVMLESIPSIRALYGRELFILEVGFTLLFTAEYIMRVVSVRRAMGYVGSFYGVVDIMAVIPTYISLFVPGAQYFLVVRILRLLRVFRILKLGPYLSQAEMLGRAMYASRIKIGVFLFTIFTVVIIVGAAIYVVEGEENGFISIPEGIYWAVVTMTTVGYGDLVPQTVIGKLLATLVMLIGYSIIAVPTGIVTVELARGPRDGESILVTGETTRICAGCSRGGHDEDSLFCKFCGTKL
jgi:voltage-gated potassium channel